MGTQRVGWIFVLAAALGMVAPAAGIAQAGALAYVSNQQGDVSVIDLTTMKPSRTLDIAARSPRGIGITEDGRWVITANKDDENISVVDTSTGRLVRQIQIGKNPEFVRVRGDFAFVTFEPSPSSGGGANAPQEGKKGDDDDNLPGHIAVVDLAAGKVILDVTGKPETEGLEFSRDGKELIVANESDNSLSVLEVSSGKLLRTVSLSKYGNRPRGIKISPDGRMYVASLELSNKLVILNDQLDPVGEVATACS